MNDNINQRNTLFVQILLSLCLKFVFIVNLWWVTGGLVWTSKTGGPNALLLVLVVEVVEPKGTKTGVVVVVDVVVAAVVDVDVDVLGLIVPELDVVEEEVELEVGFVIIGAIVVVLLPPVVVVGVVVFAVVVVVIGVVVIVEGAIVIGFVIVGWTTVVLLVVVVVVLVVLVVGGVNIVVLLPDGTPGVCVFPDVVADPDPPLALAASTIPVIKPAKAINPRIPQIAGWQPVGY